MADSNLPLVNAIEDLKGSNAKQRKALQDSLGRRFRILTSEINGLSETLATSFNLQGGSSEYSNELLERLSIASEKNAETARDNLRFQEERANLLDARALEDRRESERSNDSEALNPTQVTQDKDNKDSGSTLAGLGKLLSGAGIGLGALFAGSSFLPDFDAKAIRSNVNELLSIKDDFGGLGNFFLEGGTFGLTMAGIGAGLAAFGVGSAVGATGNVIANFVDPNWASSIVGNATKLLTLSEVAGKSNLKLLFDGAAFGMAMSGIGIGLGVFGVGAALAAMPKFENPNWASSIVDSVATLLSITDLPQVQNAGFSGTGFAGIMGKIAAGLGVFGVGAALAAIPLFMKPDFAQGVYDNVKTLYSILTLPDANLESTKKFLGVMTGIAAGLAVFGAGSTVAGVGSGLSDAIAKFSGREGDFAKKIKDQVTTILSIVGDENSSEAKADSFARTLGTISGALVKFTASKFVDSLAGVGAGILNFFTGNEAPMTQILKFAENESKLLSASSSLEKIANSLQTLTSLKFDGLDFDVEDFSDDLEDAVDNISDIDERAYRNFLDKINSLREALVGQDVQSLSLNTEGMNLDMMQPLPVRLVGAEMDARSRGLTQGQLSPIVNVTAPQTSVQNNNSTNMNSTTVVSASPRRQQRSPQSMDYVDPISGA